MCRSGPMNPAQIIAIEQQIKQLFIPILTNIMEPMRYYFRNISLRNNTCRNRFKVTHTLSPLNFCDSDFRSM